MLECYWVLEYSSVDRARALVLVLVLECLSVGKC